MEDFLQAEYIKFCQRKGRVTSAAQWAKYLGVSNASLSTWMNGVRLPTGKNVYKLADKLGPKVFDILGTPRMMPEDPQANRLMDIFFDLNEADRQRLLAYASQLEEGKDETL